MADPEGVALGRAGAPLAPNAADMAADQRAYVATVTRKPNPTILADDGSNFFEWQDERHGELIMHNLEAVLTDPDHPASVRIHAALKTTVSAVVKGEFHTYRTTADVWAALEEQNAEIASARTGDSLEQLATITFNPSSGMPDYIKRAKALRTKLAKVDFQVEDHIMITHLLRGLRRAPEYTFTCESIGKDLARGQITLQEVYQTLLRKNAWDGNDGDSSSSKGYAGNRALYAAAEHGGGGRLFRPAPAGAGGGGGGNAASRAPKLFCNYCRKIGHTKDQCRKLKNKPGGPPGGPPGGGAPGSGPPNGGASGGAPGSGKSSHGGNHGGGGNNAGLNVAWMATGVAPAPRDDREWFTDSGATQHMCCSREAFFELRPSGGVVHTASGETIEIKGIGNIFITIPNERVFALFNVLYVPELAANLLSLSKVTDMGYSVMMKGAATLIYSDDDMLPVLRAQRSANGVCSFICDYVPSLENLKSLCYEPVSLLTLHDTESECRLWHARYGHAGCDRIARIARDDLAVNFPLSASTVKDYGASHICPTCAMVKSSERPFKPTGPNNFGPGELLHTDVGDTGVRSAGGSRYYVTLIDDATGFSFFVPLASKSYVTSFLKETIPLIETATGNRVKVLRSDNGGEYNSTELHACLATKGISHQFTTPYSPASNGKAERLNRTLRESAVAMLKAAGLPKTVWAEAFHTANFLRNVLPTDGKSKTPWELFFGTKPDASRLRVFGCRAYVHTPAALRTKLEPSAQPGVFLGYPSFGVSTTDGWRVRLDNGKTVTSRHVRFDESDLPGRARTTAGATDANLVSSPPSSPLVIGSGVPLLPADNTGTGGSLSPSSSGAAAGDAGDAGDAAGDPGDAGDTAGALCSSESGNLSSISSYSSASDSFVSAGDSFGDSGDSPGPAPSSSGHSPSSGGNAARLIPGQSLVTAPRRSARIAARSAVPVQPPAIPGQPRADAFPVVEQPQSALLTTDTSGSSIVEPTSYDEAINSPQAADWIAAMAEELASLHANCTWELQTKPPGVKAIPCKWVFTLKRDAAGNIERFKARLVIKGFYQRAGIDYNDVFSPVIKYQTFRALMAAAAAHDWEVRHLDIKTAFLNGHLEEEVWMQQPPGSGEHGSVLACRLRRSLYGLKQAPRVWNQRLHAELVAMGFAQTAADPCVYYLYKEGSFIILLVYVDDILVVTPHADLAARFTARLLNAFEGRDLGPASCFLGMTIERNRAARTMKLCNPRLIYGMLERFDMGDVKPRGLPMQAGLHLSNTSGEPLNTEEFHYSALVGAAMYLATSLRPDIAHTASVLARFMAKPTIVHWQAAKGLLRYLAGTAELGINYSGGPAGLHLVGYTDADYAGCPDTRRSTSAFVFTMGGGAVSWCSQRQKTVSVSTAEAEYVAAAAAVKEALWLRNLLRELGSRNANTISIWADNQAAIKLLHNPISSARTKHIDVAYCFARERVVRGEVSFAYLPTADMVADVLTKGLPEVKHKACCAGMGMG
ncbi:hypothetical protein HT031_006855 [Scenedesmus sp. PABB004]|nr:hypothetical protein HT031_006855 [Scenedesmus sp. PABB004]